MSDNFGSNINEDEELGHAMGKVTPKPRPSRAKASAVVPVSASTPGKVRVRIILEDNDSIPPTGQFFGANGRSYILRPGEEADVPPEVISILDTAVMDTPVVDPTTKQVLGYRQRLRFPYRTIANVM
jgi:hypothetical protein